MHNVPSTERPSALPGIARCSCARPIPPPVRRSPRRFALLAKLVLSCTMLAGCQPDHAADGGSKDMFGLFKSKGAGQFPSTVAPEVHGTLRPETSLPRVAEPRPDARCQALRLDGTPPKARWVDETFHGEPLVAFKVAAQGAQPPLAVVNVAEPRARVEIWEIDGDGGFRQKRALKIDPAQEGWIISSAFEVGCLPRGQLAISLIHYQPRPVPTLYTYDIGANTFRKVSDLVYDSSSGAPDSLFNLLPAGSDAAVLLFHTGEIRLKAERYVREYDHVMLFSPRHPQGLEVLKLGLDDGNVASWFVTAKTLWLETEDRRDPKLPRRFWSLDLSSAY